MKFSRRPAHRGPQPLQTQRVSKNTCMPDSSTNDRRGAQARHRLHCHSAQHRQRKNDELITLEDTSLQEEAPRVPSVPRHCWPAGASHISYSWRFLPPDKRLFLATGGFVVKIYNNYIRRVACCKARWRSSYEFKHQHWTAAHNRTPIDNSTIQQHKELRTIENQANQQASSAFCRALM